MNFTGTLKKKQQALAKQALAKQALAKQAEANSFESSFLVTSQSDFEDDDDDYEPESMDWSVDSM